MAPYPFPVRAPTHCQQESDFLTFSQNRSMPEMIPRGPALVYGVRPGATLLLNPSVQPPAQAVYDPVTRRAVRYVETIVPTIHLGNVGHMGIGADRLYCNMGLIDTGASAPTWMASVAGGAYQQWDATAGVTYLNMTSGGHGIGVSAVGPITIYPTGFGGDGSSFTPKNAAATTASIQFVARFNTNADYTTAGLGASTGTGTFANSSTHFIQVLRNSGSWELGTCDGATISQSSGGTGDSSFHEFKVTWTAGTVTLYVDGTSTITKTTNLPTRALAIHAIGTSTGNIDLGEVLVTWA